LGVLAFYFADSDSPIAFSFEKGKTFSLAQAFTPGKRIRQYDLASFRRLAE